MIVRSGNPASFLIDYSAGVPDGDVTWSVIGPDGSVSAVGSFTPAVGAVSSNLVISGLVNTLIPGSYASYRDVTWSYTSNDAIVNGEERYSIEARVPFGASPAGVRTKLGLDDPTDLPDTEISLVRAFLGLRSGVSVDALTNADPADLTIRDAIEAACALTLIPTLTVRIAQKEDSGTSSYQRQTIDWDALSASLNGMVLAAYTLLNPAYDPTEAYQPLLILATPETDAITGSSY